jgi:putative membrane protein
LRTWEFSQVFSIDQMRLRTQPARIVFPCIQLHAEETAEMKFTLSTICFLGLISLSALAQKAKPATGDQRFVDFAAQTDMVEAHLGQLAQDAGKSQAVKDYGQMLATDHTNDFQQLQAAAQQAGFTVPTAIDADHVKAMIGPMHALKGAAFDKKFSQAMVSGHTEAVAMYQQEANESQNPALKQYAQNALPVLEKHLDKAKNLEQSK